MILKKLPFLKLLDSFIIFYHMNINFGFKLRLFVQDTIFEVSPDAQQGAGTHGCSNKDNRGDYNILLLCKPFTLVLIFFFLVG